MSSLPTSNRLLLLAGFLLIILAYFAVFQAKDGLEELFFEHEGVPMRYIGPQNAEGPLPGVIIAHGFSGSQQLMQGYAYTFAHAGYGTLLLDFSGHAKNANTIKFDDRNTLLQLELEDAYQVFIKFPFIDKKRIAILGHSMGSGAVLRQSVQHSYRYQATIAISPVARNLEINEKIPHNLQLQAGALEKPFVRNAERLFEMGGSNSAEFLAQKARAFKIIPFVEHISILFSPKSHKEALQWLNQSMQHEQTSDYTDRRILWFGIHLLGWLMVMLTIKPLWDAWMNKETMVLPTVRKPWSYIFLFAAPIVAALLMALMALVYPNIGGLGGLLVGGAFALWLFLGGTIWLFTSTKLKMPGKREIVSGLLLFVFLSLAYGYMAQLVWLPYFLIPERLIRWVFIVLACFPFFLAAGYLLYDQPPSRRLATWLGISASLLLGTLALIFLVRGVGFLILVAPVFPLVLGILVIGGSTFKRPWAFAIGGAMSFAWQVAMIFPLA